MVLIYNAEATIGKWVKTIYGAYTYFFFLNESQVRQFY